MEVIFIVFAAVVVGVPLFFLLKKHVQSPSSLSQDEWEHFYAELKKHILETSVYTQETKYNHLYHRLDNLLSQILGRHQHIILDVDAKYDRAKIMDLFVQREHHSSDGLPYNLLHGRSDLSMDRTAPDLLLFLCFFLYQGGRIQGIGEVSMNPELMIKILNGLIIEKTYAPAMFLKGLVLKYGVKIQSPPELDEAENLLEMARNNGVGAATLELQGLTIFRSTLHPKL